MQVIPNTQVKCLLLAMTMQRNACKIREFPPPGNINYPHQHRDIPILRVVECGSPTPGTTTARRGKGGLILFLLAFLIVASVTIYFSSNQHGCLAAQISPKHRLALPPVPQYSSTELRRPQSHSYYYQWTLGDSASTGDRTIVLH